MILTHEQWDDLERRMKEPVSPEKRARIAASYRRGKEMWDNMNKDHLCPYCGVKK